METVGKEKATGEGWGEAALPTSHEAALAASSHIVS